MFLLLLKKSERLPSLSDLISLLWPEAGPLFYIAIGVSKNVLTNVIASYTQSLVSFLKSGEVCHTAKSTEGRLAAP